MTIRRKTAPWLLAFALAAPITLADDAPRPPWADDAALTAVLERDGDPAAYLETLDAAWADETRSAAERFDVACAAGRAAWRFGAMESALSWFDRALELDGVADAPRLEARVDRVRVLDALGRAAAVTDAIGALLDALPADDARRPALELRRALIESDGAERDALPAFAAAHGDVAFSNRAAIVLALMGRPADALELFVAEGSGTPRFRADVRRAEWALRAGDAATAQQAAWTAVREAELRRDRAYALAVLQEAHRADETIDTLLERFSENRAALTAEERRVWIALLRERGRFDEAIELLTASAASTTFTVDERRELLEMQREAGREDAMRAEYRRLIAAEPDEPAWRIGLSRALLERGERDAALALWRSFLAQTDDALERLDAARAIEGLGLDDLAIEVAEACVTAGDAVPEALLFLHSVHASRGRLDDAVAMLDRFDALVPADATARFELAESYEQIGRLQRCVEELTALREALGVERFAEDLEMRLAWLYSEIGEEETALARWRELWTRVNSVPRRRYVEDRMMTVASRLGTLADLAIELEERLLDGTADDRDAGLLVRLYTRVGDAVSAAEVIHEFMTSTGRSDVDRLQETARVYVECNDYYNYERTIRELIEVDPDGEGEYLRQLAMSQLERGRPDEARDVLARLATMEVDSVGAEFEAGVLALAGLRDEAIRAYQRGLATYPDRIESYLLMANLMRERGGRDEAIGMFQYLAEHAERDDLFTIAIDGLLNMEAPAPVLAWAKRTTLARLAEREGRNYLYQLVRDLAEQEGERESMMIALENALPVSGSRRPSVLRELMDMARGDDNPFGGGRSGADPVRHLAYGRRLIGLAEVVPPQVYLDLGEAFLDADDADAATRTFGLARDLPDRVAYERQVAERFENAGHLDAALRAYERLVLTNPAEATLLRKLAQLHEQLGRDPVASDVYAEALELLTLRSPVWSQKDVDDAGVNGMMWWGARNVDEYQRHAATLQRGIVVTLASRDAAAAFLSRQRARLDAELEELRSAWSTTAPDAPEHAGDDAALASRVLARAPRIQRRTATMRGVALAFGLVETADAVDAVLLATFTDDATLLRRLCQTRADWALYDSAQRLIEGAARPEAESRAARFIAGLGSADDPTRLVPSTETSRLFLPMLVRGNEQALRDLLHRTQFKRDDDPAAGPAFFSFGGASGELALLLAVARSIDDENLCLRLGRQWMAELLRSNQSYYIEQALPTCLAALGEANQRSLCQYVVELIFEEPEKAAGVIQVLPTLQKQFDEPLATEEQILTLLDGYGEGGYAWGLGPVLVLLPEDARGPAARTVWNKVAKTGRASFLLGMVNELPEPAGESLSAFIVESVGESIGDNASMAQYYVGQLAQTQWNVDLAERVCGELLDAGVVPDLVRAVQAELWRKLGRTDEAITRAAEMLLTLPESGTEYPMIQARNVLLMGFLPEHGAALLDAVEAQHATVESTPERCRLKIMIAQRMNDRARTLTELEAAVAAHPDEDAFRTQLRGAYLSAGRRDDALRLAQERIDQTEGDERVVAQRTLYQMWRSLDHPERALALREALEDEPAEAPAAASGMTRIVQPNGAIIIVSSAIAGDQGSGAATIEDLQDAIDADDAEAAQRTLRSLWRSFPADQPSPYFMGSMMRLPATWPARPDDDDATSDDPERAAERAAETARQRQRARGGLDAFLVVEPESAEEPDATWSVLAQHAFGRAELDRYLRSRQPAELSMLQAAMTADLERRRASADDATILAALIADAEVGRAGRRELMLLLALLSEHPEYVTPETRDMLGALLRTIPASETSQHARIAELLARTGAADEAQRLFRWCGTQASMTQWNPFGGGTTPIAAKPLVELIRETFDDEAIVVALVGDVLDLADPGRSWWGNRQLYERLVLETWNELLEPDAALARCERILDDLGNFEFGVRRETAKRGAALLARAGRHDDALRALDIGLCRLDPNDLPAAYRWWATSSGALSRSDLERLAPADVATWRDPAGWYRTLSAALWEWVDEERVEFDRVTSMLALLAWRTHDAGDANGAREMLTAVRERLEAGDRGWLWVIDVARRIGDESLARSCEIEQLHAGRLSIARVADGLSALHAEAGATAGLEAAERVLAYTRDPDALAVAITMADAAGDAARRERYAQWARDAEAARDALRALDEAEAERAREAAASSST